jgi:predicted metal-dependent hydrolase
VKTLRLTWRHGGKLILTVPRRIDSSAIDGIFADHLEWIIGCQRKQNRCFDHADMPRLHAGGYVLYRGGMIPIVLPENGPGVASVTLRSGRLLLPRGLVDQQHQARLITGWLRLQARTVLFPILAETAGRMAVTINNYSLRNQSTRWASWSARHNINLNWRLIMAPPDVFDYIAVHELSHAFHPDHSNRFWNCVARWCPDWKASRLWLRNHRFLLAAFRDHPQNPPRDGAAGRPGKKGVS